jgi:RimJ/RimL family protein N-acetyltransferase
MDDMQSFAKLLGASIAENWPLGECDRDAMQFFMGKLQEGGTDAEGWYGWYAIRQATQTEPATLVGAGDYFGPPDQTGTVELGYSISEGWRGQGLGAGA